MNGKTFSFFAIAFLAILALSSLASADLNIIPSSMELNSSHNSQVTFSFTINSTNTDFVRDINYTSSSNSNLDLVSISGPSSLANSTATITAIYSVKNRVSPGTYTISVTAAGVENATSNAASDSIDLTVRVASAPGISFSSIQSSISATQNGSFKLFNNGNSVAPIILNVSGSVNATLSLSGISPYTVSSPQPGAESSTITVIPSNINFANLGFGTHSAVVTASQGSNSVSQSFSFTKGFCRNGEKGTNLSVSNLDIKNEGNGDDDAWRLLDTIEIEATIDNNEDQDIKDVVAELGIFDSSGNNIANDLEFEGSDDEKVDVGKINENNDEKVVFRFKVPADIDIESYDIIVKATSKKSSESDLCAESSSESMSIDEENDEGKFITFNNIEFTPTEASCLETVSLTLDAVNIGENNEDRIRVRLYSKDFGIDMTREITSGLDRGDSDEVSFEFRIPQGLAEKYYNLELDADYDYDNGDYHETLDETEKVPFKVFGCSGVTGNSSSNAVTISASLESDANPGEDLEISVVIRNNNVNPASFVVDLKGYSDWATLKSISDRSITLDGGESETIDLVLVPNADISGDQDFTIEVQSGNTRQTKEVVVEFAGSGSSSFGFFKDNKMAWIIGLVNLILIILIIIVAVKVSKS